MKRDLPRAIGILLALLLSLGWIFGPHLVEHVRNSAAFHHLNDDAQQQIWPFLREHDARLFSDDYLADYQRRVNPGGYDVLYRLTARWIDPRTFSKALPYALLALMLWGVGWTAWRLGGAAAAWGALALCLSTDVYLQQLVGGLPRSFAFPLMAVAAVALTRGSPVLLMVVILAGAAFYFPVAIVGCLMLGMWLLLPRDWGGLDVTWSIPRRLAVLVGAAGVSGVMILPTLLALRDFGPSIGPADWTTYPEAGPGGRFVGVNLVARPPLAQLPEVTADWATRSFLGWDGAVVPFVRQFGGAHRSAVLWAIALVLMAGYAQAWRQNMAARRLPILVIGGIAGYLVAWALAPLLYVPERYVRYCLPVALAIGLPVAASALVRSLVPPSWNRWLSPALAVSVSAAVVLLVGGRGSRDAGLTVQVPAAAQGLYAQLAALPPDALIAGWPTAVDAVPYLAARRVLLSYETHLPFHAAYLREMRARMTALSEAYFAVDARPLVRLRDEFGVTHFVIDLDHYDDTPPQYFKPFDEEVVRLRQQAGSGGEILRQRARAEVFRQGTVVVLDLDRIRP